MIRISTRGDSNRTKRGLEKMSSKDIFSDLERYGEMGVRALSNATPVDSGLAANSWSYKVIRNRRRPGIEWYNSDIEGGTPVVILIQYGHATRSGTFIQGRDFINPAMRPVFDAIVDNVWKKVNYG